MASQTMSEKFQEHLLLYSQTESTEERHSIEETLWGNYGAEYAVFVLDMSGFSLLTRKYGIVHYLSMVRRMQLTTEPIVKSYGGFMIKYEADNCFAVFPDPLSADGKILIIGHEDCFGDPVNRASKIGEDLAAASEILITKEAMQMIPVEAGIKAHEMSVSISGITIPAYLIEYRNEDDSAQLSQ